MAWGPRHSIGNPHCPSWVMFLRSPQQRSAVPGWGYLSWGFCGLIGPVRQSLHPGSHLRLWGVLFYLVPKQAGPTATLAGIRGHQQRWVACLWTTLTPQASPGCLGARQGTKLKASIDEGLIQMLPWCSVPVPKITTVWLLKTNLSLGVSGGHFKCRMASRSYGHC